jgi:hypothetical protein
MNSSISEVEIFTACSLAAQHHKFSHYTARTYVIAIRKEFLSL